MLAANNGADFIVAETFGSYAEAKLALDCIQKYGNGETLSYVGSPNPDIVFECV